MDTNGQLENPELRKHWTEIYEEEVTWKNEEDSILISSEILPTADEECMSELEKNLLALSDEFKFPDNPFLSPPSPIPEPGSSTVLRSIDMLLPDVQFPGKFSTTEEMKSIEESFAHHLIRLYADPWLKPLFTSNGKNDRYMFNKNFVFDEYDNTIHGMHVQMIMVPYSKPIFKKQTIIKKKFT